MKYTLWPARISTPPIDEIAIATSIDLGGFFYDYFRNSAGAIVGVKYWILGAPQFDSHPVFSQFLEDERFIFDSVSQYVDMVFDKRDAPALRKGELTADVAHHFGGERVIGVDNDFGIEFFIV